MVFCHGFPGLWYSWRHQLPVLAAAGYRAVALDMRGYGESARPASADQYGYDSLSQDVLAVLDYFGAEQAVLVGHDFGANLAWHMASHHAPRLRGVVSLCVPYEMALAGGGDELPSRLYAQIAANHFFHMHYYQQPGLAEQGCLGREREFLLKLFWALSAEGELLNWEKFPMAGTAYIDVLAEPGKPLPWSWLSQEDFDVYVSAYLNCDDPALAFVGGASAYRVMDRNWRMFRDSAHTPITLPAAFIGGAQDPVVKLGSEAEFEHMRALVEDLRIFELLPDAGHFVQQEQPQATTTLLLQFLQSL